MSDEKQPAAPASDSAAAAAPATASTGGGTVDVVAEGVVTETVVTEAVAVEAKDAQGNVQAEGVIVTDFTHTLIVAEFADENAALETYNALREAERDQGLTIDAVVVVRADADGKIEAQKVTDHSTRNGVAWGVAGGIVLGVLFPPSILAGAVVVGTGGGVVGKLRAVHHKNELEKELEGALAPNTSGIVALIQTTDAPKAKETMPKATKVVEKPIDDATAAAITEESQKASK